MSSTSNLACEAGCGLTVSRLDHSRIVPALAMTFHQFSDIFFEILQCHFSWQAQYLVRLEGTPVAPRIANAVSYVTRIKQSSHFAWQAQYLVRLKCVFSCQVQHLVKF